MFMKQQLNQILDSQKTYEVRIPVPQDAYRLKMPVEILMMEIPNWSMSYSRDELLQRSNGWSSDNWFFYQQHKVWTAYDWFINSELLRYLEDIDPLGTSNYTYKVELLCGDLFIVLPFKDPSLASYVKLKYG